ncbi:type A2 lantipeptide [Streptomyces sp. DASNCL29]|uniref:type A2 lantipeptide n=1 Tax=Streptomyces sp. DASNCL29 TaxID=2583819 RepID=UPI00110F97CA|nr:type A2 lantipeptide [Streptomyces sp. DASNCL29]TMU93407.1 type A2 lantipeptide [Streptomyces sp. DASNCL29]
MRKQIEAIEIADSELDNVSGGVLGTVNLTGGAEPALPTLPTLPTLGGSVSGGLSGQVGPVSGQAGFSGGVGI